MNASVDALPIALSGERRDLIDEAAGRVSYFVAGPRSARGSNQQPDPLLLVHSINASASSHEVKPIFEAMKSNRRVYAVDLPGFGHSDRSDRPYVQRLMVDAIHAMIETIRAETGADRVDALAVSLSCEFLGKAALERPDSIRRLALVSPTGFAKNTPRKGSPDESIGKAGVLRALNGTRLGAFLFRLLRSERSIRFFLRKTWGRKEIDEAMFRTSVRMARYPGAEHAPFHFIAGYLFSACSPRIYEAVQQPAWLAHGVRGDFADYSRTDCIDGQPNWTVEVFDTGALPYFEVPEAFHEGLLAFLEDR